MTVERGDEMTSTLTRTIHTDAGGFDPAFYEYVDSFDDQPGPGSYIGQGAEFEVADGVTVWGTNWLNAHDRYLEGLLQESPTSEYKKGERGSQCDHCGAWIRYVTVWRYTPTGDYIASGSDCADLRFVLPDRAAFDVKKLKERAASLRERAELDAALVKWGESNPGVLDFFIAYETESEAGAQHWSDEFVLDVARKLRRYGDISERQIEAVRKAFIRDGEKERDRLLRSLNPEATAPIPEGRVEFTGEILSQRTQESDFGTVTKILVKSAEGFKVWLTKPAALSQAGAEVGDTVTITATLTPSDDDPSFGFGKRPSKASVVQ
jgi:hypothetical protein